MNAARFLSGLRRVCAPVVLYKEDEPLAFSASIQPELTHEQEQNSVAGFGTPPRFCLYAPCCAAAAQMRPGDRMGDNGGFYRVLRVRQVMLCGEPVYWWASLCGELPHEGGEEA